MLNVFLVDTDMFLDEALYRAAYRQMSACRRDKIDAFRFDGGRRLSLGAGVALDAALRGLGLREREMAIAAGAHGKPSFRDMPELRFNLSHSGSYAVCALSDEGEVGIDVEQIGRVGEPLIRRTCAVREARRLLALPPEERDAEFFRLWTVKESFMKLTGRGLAMEPDRLEPSPDMTVLLDGAPQQARLHTWRVGDCWLTLCAGVPSVPVLTEPDREALWALYRES